MYWHCVRMSFVSRCSMASIYELMASEDFHNVLCKRGGGMSKHCRYDEFQTSPAMHVCYTQQEVSWKSRLVSCLSDLLRQIVILVGGWHLLENGRVSKWSDGNIKLESPRSNCLTGVQTRGTKLHMIHLIKRLHTLAFSASLSLISNSSICPSESNCAASVFCRLLSTARSRSSKYPSLFSLACRATRSSSMSVSPTLLWFIEEASCTDTCRNHFLIFALRFLCFAGRNGIKQWPQKAQAGSITTWRDQTPSWMLCRQRRWKFVVGNLGKFSLVPYMGKLALKLQINLVAQSNVEEDASELVTACELQCWAPQYLRATDLTSSDLDQTKSLYWLMASLQRQPCIGSTGTWYFSTSAFMT